MTTDPLSILHQELEDTRAALEFHQARGKDGAIEAWLAGLKISWLRGLIYKITGEVPPNRGRR